jgi:broad specificity phosphatase PhoE
VVASLVRAALEGSPSQCLPVRGASAFLGRDRAQAAAPSGGQKCQAYSRSAEQDGKLSVFWMYLVLHGQTQLNLERRAQGRCDSPLTDKGVRQATELAVKLKRITASPTILCTPLGRSRATATIIARYFGLTENDLKVEPRLDEVHLGEWEGLTREEIVSGWPELIGGGNDYGWPFRAPKGERLTHVKQRLSAWLHDLRDHHELVVVGHGISSRVLRGLYTGLPDQKALQLSVDRAAISILQTHGMENTLPL